MPGSVSQFAMYGLFPSTATAFPFYSANGAQLQNSVAFGQSQSSEASTVHNDYYNDNHKVSAYGKKCSNYVCAHSADSIATRMGNYYWSIDYIFLPWLTF